MKKTTFVALLLLYNSLCFANANTDVTQSIESEWASIYYSTLKQTQEAAYDALLQKTEQLLAQQPGSTDLMYWQAVVMASRAGLQNGFAALKAIKESKNILEKIVKTKPQTANGSAYVVLGTLYYMAPKWPIAFGDDEKAKSMFEAALKINPQGIDANYFYGDYLLANNKAKEAQLYFQKALSAPTRKSQEFADNMLKEEVKLALSNTKNRKIDGVKSALLSFFNSASLK